MTASYFFTVIVIVLLLLLIDLSILLGMDGMPGMIGFKGEVGPAGLQGEEGRIGPPGKFGYTGDPGAIGQPGPRGRAGQPGKTNVPWHSQFMSVMLKLQLDLRGRSNWTEGRGWGARPSRSSWVERVPRSIWGGWSHWRTRHHG